MRKYQKMPARPVLLVKNVWHVSACPAALPSGRPIVERDAVFSLVIAPSEDVAVERAQKALLPALIRKHKCFRDIGAVPVFVVAHPRCDDPTQCELMAPVIWGVRSALDLASRGEE